MEDFDNIRLVRSEKSCNTILMLKEKSNAVKVMHGKFLFLLTFFLYFTVIVFILELVKKLLMALSVLFVAGNFIKKNSKHKPFFHLHKQFSKCIVLNSGRWWYNIILREASKICKKKIKWELHLFKHSFFIFLVSLTYFI